jgi:hypothetical protein
MKIVTFTTTVESRPRGGVAVQLPFDPSVAWGEKQRHYVTGTIQGRDVRGTITSVGGQHYLQLGPSWCRDRRVAAGNNVTVMLEPEGPQLASLAIDISSALEAEPEARQFFESLAPFYRNGYIRWVEEAKRAETRAKRIAETLSALLAGKKQP